MTCSVFDVASKEDHEGRAVAPLKDIMKVKVSDPPASMGVIVKFIEFVSSLLT